MAVTELSKIVNSTVEVLVLENDNFRFMVRLHEVAERVSSLDCATLQLTEATKGNRKLGLVPSCQIRCDPITTDTFDKIIG